MPCANSKYYWLIGALDRCGEHSSQLAADGSMDSYLERFIHGLSPSIQFTS